MPQDDQYVKSNTAGRIGRPPIDEAVRARARTVAENNPKWSARRITKEIQKQFEEETPPRTDWPSESSVRRIVQDHRSPGNEAERSAYAYVRWPESFECGALPWESAASLLPELRHFGADRPSSWMSARRPSIRWAIWLWRIKLAAPDISLDLARGLAGVMAGAEVSGAELTETWRKVEAKLMNPDASEEMIVVPFTADASLEEKIAVMREVGPTVSDDAYRSVLKLMATLRDERLRDEDHDDTT